MTAPRTPSPATLEKLSRWYALKAQVAALIAEEAALRQEIFGEAFPRAPEKGSTRVSIGHGKDLKATTRLNYAVTREVYEAARDACAAGVPGALPRNVLTSVIRLKPEVVDAAFLAVTDPAHKRLLSGFITSKAGLPTLEIVDVKRRGS